MLTVIALSVLVAGLPSPTGGAIYQSGVTDLAPTYVNPSCAPVAVLGINLSQNAGEVLQTVTLTFTDYGSDGRFTTGDLLSLGTDSSSGVALYSDNKTSGTFGEMDANDSDARLSAQPSWTVQGGNYRVTLTMQGIPIPADDLGNNSGPDFFVVVRTSSSASDGDDFTVTLFSDNITTDGGPVAFTTTSTDRIIVDAVDPKADAGPDLTTDEGAETSFFGGASTDNIALANYSWFFGDFVQDIRAFGMSVTHTYQYPGTYIAVLNVTDIAGNSDEDTATVMVRNVNQPPTIISTAPTSAVQGETYFYLCQAADPDGDSLKFALLEGPANMTIDPRLGLVVWMPGMWELGGWQVAISVSDGTTSVKQYYMINVANVNDPPFFESSPVLIGIQNEPYNYWAEAKDPDFDVQLVYSLVTGPKGMTVTPYTGLATWTPASDQVGLNRVVLAASDGFYTAYQDFMVNVSNSNDPPVILSVPLTAAQQGMPYAYRVKAFDPDGDELAFYLNPAPANMTVDTKTGAISWTPGSDQVGTALVRLEVRDDRGGSANQTFYIDVANINDAPVVNSVPPVYAKQGSPYTYRLQATDPDGDPLTYTLLAGPKGLVMNSSFGTLEWIPRQESVGRNQVVVEVSDGRGGLALQSFAVMVQDVNDAPVVTGDIAPFAFQNKAYVSQVVAYDPDGDDISFTLITQLPNMDLDRRTGILVWYPSKAQVGQYRIAIRVTDQNGTSVDAYFNITVLGTNDPPSVEPIGLLKAREGERFAYCVVASDPDCDAMSFYSDSKIFKINRTSGDISFVPAARDVGTHEFAVNVIDACGMNQTVTGVMVISARPASTPASKIAGFGLAGIAGFSGWAIVGVAILAAVVLTADYLRLRGGSDAPVEPDDRAAGAKEPGTGGPVREGARRDAREGAGTDRKDGEGGRAAEDRQARPGSRKCAGCRQTVNINATADNHACSCGAVYHKDCLRKMGNKCAACGRGKDDRKKGK